MVSSWERGKEPWNDMEGTDPNSYYWKLPEPERRSIYLSAYQNGHTEGKIRDSRLPELLPESRSAVDGFADDLGDLLVLNAVIEDISDLF